MDWAAAAEKAGRVSELARVNVAEPSYAKIAAAPSAETQAGRALPASLCQTPEPGIMLRRICSPSCEFSFQHLFDFHSVQPDASFALHDVEVEMVSAVS
jgi:hypothetical protein